MKICLRFLAVCLPVLAMIGCDGNPDADTAAAEDPSPRAASAVAPPKAPHAKYAVQWVSNDIPGTMVAGTTTTVNVRAKNTGDWTWLDAAAANPAKPDGTYAVRLTYRWVNSENKPLPENSGRGEIAASVPAGETADFTIQVEAPKQPGSYTLQMDLVEEIVTFFSAKGAQKLVVPVTIQ